ncbi:hypothetical protein LSH36_2573g00000 [Paralvinella palmiformis]|uniref:Uncharacterized protein n=1 Tax=Paralvinella palmiformis TaxID=53620 RepID=A0AAD9IPK7_9ANNE|nr:hypothetical protein LSH36_2573g00000 [Paralvinella palmiformis]
MRYFILKCENIAKPRPNSNTKDDNNILNHIVTLKDVFFTPLRYWMVQRF